MTDAPTTVITADGRLFRFDGSEPYTRKDGRPSGLLRWIGACAECGAHFTVKTPVNLDGTKSFCRRHCDTHKRSDGPANPLSRVSRGVSRDVRATRHICLVCLSSPLGERHARQDSGETACACQNPGAEAKLAREGAACDE
jgi:hypothetical protein